jgi:hypothetical protein
MFKHVAYFQIVFTLGCTHFAFANAGRADRDSFSRDADRQEMRQMKSEKPTDNNGTPAVKPDNGVQMIARQGPRIPCPVELGVCGRV